jgi:hypothetical protein
VAELVDHVLESFHCWLQGEQHDPQEIQNQEEYSEFFHDADGAFVVDDAKVMHGVPQTN